MKQKAKPAVSAAPETKGPPLLFTTAWRARRTWVVAAVLVLVVGTSWWSSLGNGFNYDDEGNLLENEHYRGLGPSHLAWMFTTFHLGHYQPLAWITLGLDYLLWGVQPFGYHLTNLILHAANTLLVYLLALAILGAQAGTPKAAAGGVGWPVYLAAGLAALFFGVHPLRVESVAWITERRDVLSSLFLLVAVLLYLHAHGGRSAGRRWVWIVAVLVAYTLSLLSRAMGVTLPVVLLVLDCYPLRRLGRDAGGWTGPPAWRVYLEKVPFVVLAIGFAAVAPLAQESAGAAMGVAQHGPLERMAQACYGLVFYLWKTVVPHGLAPLYEIREPIPVFSAKYLGSAALVVLGGFLVLRYGRRWRWLAVVTLLYAILLAPVLGFVQSGRQEVADRYSYLPAIGWAILAGAGLLRLPQSGRRRGLARACTAGAMGVVTVFAVLTWRQTRVWHDEISLWEQAVRYAPSATAHQNLGGVWTRTGRLADAVEQYRATLSLEPLHGPALYGLAKALTDLKRWAEAKPHWETLRQAFPGDAESRFQLATVYRECGDLDAARQEYEEVVRLKPQWAGARVDLGALLLDAQQVDEAIASFRAALEVNPNFADALYNLGNALSRRGDTEGAADAYRRTLAAKPDYAAAANNLAVLLEKAGRRAEALEAFRTAARGQPENTAVRMNFVRALERAGRREEAVAELRDMLQRDPTHAEARQALRALGG